MHRLGVPGILLGVVAMTALFALYFFDPATSRGFLPCPFHWLTGLDCPGCGSQRALHDLLHGRVGEAFGHNAALVCAIPILGLQWGASRFRPRDQPWSADNRVVIGWAVALVGWGVLRNLA
ncbi:MAG: DUF2752 domain-containing protein [Flavobacteriales bacterium]